MKKIIILPPHPDDETLGAGGSLLKFKKMGYEVYWLICTHISINAGWNAEQIKKREEEIQEVSAQYQFDGVFNLKYDPTMLKSIGSIKALPTNINP